MEEDLSKCQYYPRAESKATGELIMYLTMSGIALAQLTTCYADGKRWYNRLSKRRPSTYDSVCELHRDITNHLQSHDCAQSPFNQTSDIIQGWKETIELKMLVDELRGTGSMSSSRGGILREAISDVSATHPSSSHSSSHGRARRASNHSASSGASGRNSRAESINSFSSKSPLIPSRSEVPGGRSHASLSSHSQLRGADASPRRSYQT